LRLYIVAICFLAGLNAGLSLCGWFGFVHVDLFAFSDPLLARYWGRETGQCKPSPPFKRFRRIAAY